MSGLCVSLTRETRRYLTISVDEYTVQAYDAEMHSHDVQYHTTVVNYEQITQAEGGIPRI